jgi:hypothetical protein
MPKAENDHKIHRTTEAKERDMSTKNYVLSVVVQVDDDVSALAVAKQIAECVARHLNETNIWVQVGPPGEPFFDVNPDGSVLLHRVSAEKRRRK